MEKNSALLEIDGEEHIPVDADHEQICKFMDREDEVYKKLFKRIRRMIKEQDGIFAIVPVRNSDYLLFLWFYTKVLLICT